MTAKDVALIGTLAALAAVGRLPFAFLPGVQPTTFLVMMAGYVFGARAGFTVGAVAALVSNFFLGQGPWTPWQMLGWGLAGLSAAALAVGTDGFRYGGFLLLCGLWGYLFGCLTTVWHWMTFIYPLTWKTFWATYLAGLGFDTAHAVGNVVFTVFLGRPFYSILVRFKKKFTVHSVDELS